MTAPIRTDHVVVILLVDDDPGDRELTRRALERNAHRVDLRMVSDGGEALDYLLRRGPYRDPHAAPRPDLILLDLNMPRVNGHRVLEELREHTDLDRIPITVLTTSNSVEDVLRSYDLGCNSYIQKPAEVDDFMNSIRRLEEYWFDLVALPPRDALVSLPSRSRPPWRATPLA